MKFIYLGDSIMAADRHEFGYNNVTYNNAEIGKMCVGYPSLIHDALGRENAKNISVGGHNVFQQYELAVKEDFGGYDGVVIAVGVNDFSLGKKIGDFEKGEDGEYEESFCGYYCRMLDHIYSSNPKIKVILMTPLKRDTMHLVNGAYRNDYFCSVSGNRLSDFSDAIKKIADRYSCTVADMYSESGLNIYNLPLYTFEGVHPTNEGYRYIIPPLLAAIKRTFNI